MRDPKHQAALDRMRARLDEIKRHCDAGGTFYMTEERFQEIKGHRDTLAKVIDEMPGKKKE